MPDLKNVRDDAANTAEDVYSNLAKALDDLREEVKKLDRRDRGGPPRGLLFLVLAAAIAAAVVVVNGRANRDADTDDWA